MTLFDFLHENQMPITFLLGTGFCFLILKWTKRPSPSQRTTLALGPFNIPTPMPDAFCSQEPWIRYTNALWALEPVLERKTHPPPEDVLGSINANKDDLFPKHAWIEPKFLVNQSHLTIYINHLVALVRPAENKNVTAINLAVDRFWGQFENYGNFQEVL